MSEILPQIESIFRDLFDDEDLTVSESTVADDIDDWDSITNIQLLVLIEKRFGVKFTAAEIHGFKNVGDMVSCIEGKR